MLAIIKDYILIIVYLVDNTLFEMFEDYTIFIFSSHSFLQLLFQNYRTLYYIIQV